MTLEEFINQLETYCPALDVPIKVEVMTADNDFAGVKWELYVMAGYKRVRFVVAPTMKKEGGEA